ncbi:MAG: hypothetical protein M5U12_28050 [Verrucomicrobia bacterium]|nr:hypothetical protein [Verrucomicrobiota bacterium]
MKTHHLVLTLAMLAGACLLLAQSLTEYCYQGQPSAPVATCTGTPPNCSGRCTRNNTDCSVCIQGSTNCPRNPRDCSVWQETRGCANVNGVCGCPLTGFQYYRTLGYYTSEC